MKEKRARGRKSPVSKGLEPKKGTFTSGRGAEILTVTQIIIMEEKE